MIEEIELKIYCILEDMHRFNTPVKEVMEKIKKILTENNSQKD